MPVVAVRQSGTAKGHGEEKNDFFSKYNFWK
jgi:hypothetical protein